MLSQSKVQQRLCGVKELTFYDRRFLKNLLKGKKKEVEKPTNQMDREECKMAFPKSKWFQPAESPSTKAEIPENLLQDYANEAITLKSWTYIRFHTALLGWIKNNPAVPQWVRKCFFSQVAGKLPDNLIMAQVAPGMFLACKMELKTQDSKGRAVGKTHGKQKHYAEAEEWYIARSPEQINKVLEEIQKAVTKTILAVQLPRPDLLAKPKVSDGEKDIGAVIHQLVDVRIALQAGYPDVALDNVNEIIARHEK